MQLLVSEILDKIETAKSVPERKEILNKNKSPRLKEFMQHLFGDYTWFIKDESELPEWYPAKEEKGYTASTLLFEVRRFYIFYEETTKVDYERKKALLAQLLESIHPDESQVLIGMLLGTLKVKGLTKKLVTDFWPDLLED